MRHQFTDEQRQELIDLDLYPEQLQRLETSALQSISWRQTPAPRMQDVRDRLTDLEKALKRAETLYIRMSTSKGGASQEANARLQSAADDLFADADELGESLETAAGIVNRALEWLSPARRSTRRDTAYFVRLILHALEVGHSDHFDCRGFGDTAVQAILPPFLIRVARKKKPFADVVRIVSNASGGWSADDAIRAYLRLPRDKVEMSERRLRRRKRH
jgi:hypothetical protein